MNFKGILLVMLLAIFGAAVGMSEIKPGPPVPLTISGVPQDQKVVIKAGKPARISIYGVPAEDKAKIDTDYPLTERGTINLPFIGEINAVDKTLEKLARDIEKAYVDAKIFLEPAVRVSNVLIIQDPNPHVIHIGGQVAKPGPIHFAEGMTLWKAIQAAGGATEFGSVRRVKLYRDGEQTTYDMTNKENHSLLLKADDTIEVPQMSGCWEH